MRPNALIVRAYLSRGTQSWLITRAIASVVFLRAGINPLHLSAAAAVEVIFLSVIVSFLETRHRRERALLGNLGVRPLMLAALFAGPALSGELAVRFGAAAFQ